MSYNMMEAYQVKMAQLADELKQTGYPKEPTRHLVAETWEWIQRQLGRPTHRAPVAREQVA